MDKMFNIYHYVLKYMNVQVYFYYLDTFSIFCYGGSCVNHSPRLPNTPCSYNIML